MGINEKTTSKKNIFEPVVNYFREVKGELKKVSWPTFKRIVQNTLIVLLFVLLIGIVIWVLDFGFSKGGQMLLNQTTTQQSTDQGTNQGAAQTELTEEQMDTFINQAGLSQEELAKYKALSVEQKREFVTNLLQVMQQAQQNNANGSANPATTGTPGAADNNTAGGGTNPTAGSKANGQ